MPRSFANANKKLLLGVATAFGDLLDQVVFLGGATTTLLVDQGAEVYARPTDDVDVIADLVTRADYYKFSEDLRAHGFREDQSDKAPLCRWIATHLDVEYTVDVMPIDESILGFSNRWYEESMNTAVQVTLEQGIQIRVVQPLYFLATKFEAFHGRFEGDYLSRDIQDIACLLEHRNDLPLELLDAKPELQEALRNEFRGLSSPDFLNVLPGLLDDPQSLATVKRKIELLS